MRNFGRRIILRLPLPHRVVEFYDRFEEGVFGAVALRQMPILVILTGLIWTTEAMRLFLVVEALGIPGVHLGHQRLVLRGPVRIAPHRGAAHPGRPGYRRDGRRGHPPLAYGVPASAALAITLVDRTISVLSIIVLGSIAYVLSPLRRGVGLRGAREVPPATSIPEARASGQLRRERCRTGTRRSSSRSSSSRGSPRSSCSQAGIPAVVEAAFFIALAVAIPVMVFYLMAEEGWSTLARRYRARAAFAGPWRPCPTGQMALVSVDDPEFQRRKLRLVGGTLRLGTSPEALHLSMLFSKIPLLGLFFPDVRIPWSAVTSARTYEAPGWFRPASEPGTLLQVGYDPNYTGTFVELAVGDAARVHPAAGGDARRGDVAPAAGARGVGRAVRSGTPDGGAQAIRTASDRTGPLRAALRVVRDARYQRVIQGPGP